MNILFFLIVLKLAWGRVDELEEFERMMEEPTDRSKWVDPLDMGMYDTKQNNCKDLEKRLGACDKNLGECHKKLDNLARSDAKTNINNITTKTAQPEIEIKSTPVKSSGEIFLKRHVSHLISKLNLAPLAKAHLKVEIELDPFQIQTLHNFVTPNSNVHAVDVDQILTSFIKSVDTFETFVWVEGIKEQLTQFRDPLLVILMVLALVYFTFVVLRRMPPFKILLLVIVVSIVWHWVHLYKATWATKHSKLMQSVQIPPECRPQEMTWLQTVQSSASSMFSTVDKCEDYHKAIMVDPIYEVNPLTALVDLATKLLLQPLSSLGKEVGAMFSGLLGSVPFFWKVPVLLVFVILLMFVMILFAGYKVRLPLFLGEIGPANNRSNNVALEQQISDLTKMIADMKVGNNVALVDGTTGNYLEHKTLGSRQNSGIEELLPLGYDCREKNHQIEVSKRSEVASRTPTKQVKRRVVDLTLAKGRVNSQPNIHHKSVDFSGDTALDCDLTRKRSDSFPKSPLKTLVAKDCDSPKSTTFEWMYNEEPVNEEVDNVTDTEEVVEDTKSDFLNKVEGVFETSVEV